MPISTLVFCSRSAESHSHILPETEEEKQGYEGATQKTFLLLPPPSQAATIPEKSDLLKGIFTGFNVIRIVSRTIRFGLLGGLCSNC